MYLYATSTEYSGNSATSACTIIVDAIVPYYVVEYKFLGLARTSSTNEQLCLQLHILVRYYRYQCTTSTGSRTSTVCRLLPRTSTAAFNALLRCIMNEQ